MAPKLSGPPLHSASSGSTLQRLTEKCLGLFSQCLLMPVLNVESKAWFEDNQAKLRWWAFGLNVQNPGRSSLDHRLKDSDDIRNVLANLLSGLAVALTECLYDAEKEDVQETTCAQDVVDQDPSSASSTSSVSSASESFDDSEQGGNKTFETQFPEQAYYIKMHLRHLMRISILIRKSGDRFRHELADANLRQVESTSADKYKEFRKYLATLILIGQFEYSLLTKIEDAVERKKLASSVKIVIRAWLNNRLTSTQQRLIQANVVRRNRILFSRNRLKERPLQEIIESKYVDQPTVTKLNESVIPRAVFNKPQSVSTLGLVDQPSVVQKATAIGPDFDPGVIGSNNATSMVSKVTQISQTQDYPKCAILEKNLQCPYCSFVLEPEYAKDEKKWRGHVAHDLSPYSCVFEDCKVPYDLYTNQEQWLEHMRNSHSETRWICSNCSFDSDRDNDVTFTTKLDLEKHMEELHASLFISEELPVLVELSERSMIKPVLCPLCLHNRNPIQLEYDDHIAEHIHAFSLQALPWDFDIDDGGASAGEEPVHMLVSQSSHDSEIDTEILEDIMKDINSLINKVIIKQEHPILYKPLTMESFSKVKNLLAKISSWIRLSHITSSHREKCSLFLGRLRDNMDQLLTSEHTQDAEHAQDLGTNILLDFETLEEYISKKSPCRNVVLETALKAQDSISELIETISQIKTIYDSFFSKDINSTSQIKHLVDDINTFKDNLERYKAATAKHNLTYSGYDSIQRTLDDCRRFLDDYKAVLNPKLSAAKIFRTAQFAYDHDRVNRLRKQITSHKDNLSTFLVNFLLLNSKVDASAIREQAKN